MRQKGFHVHPKLWEALGTALRMGQGSVHRLRFAEALAFGSVLLEGNPVRLTGQDSQRGTFNQKTLRSCDTQTEEDFCRSRIFRSDQAFCEIHNSSLSEGGCLDLNRFQPRLSGTLVLWEAIWRFRQRRAGLIDKFISEAEDKWNLPSGVVMLLPHGYEGQGPEHSSARIERYLQLAGEDNIVICQPSNAAQYFHMRAPGSPPVEKTPHRLHAEKHAAPSRRELD